MSINFNEVTATLTATEAEVEQFDAAKAALDEAKAALVTAQDTVATAQETVTTATETTSAEKADVVAGITQAIQQLNALLTELQS